MKKISSPKLLAYVAIVIIVIVGIFIAFSTFTKKAGQGECSQYSNKDGYTGCMSLMNGKDKKCKFKVDNKVNEATQKMEFTYTCVQK